MLLGLIGLLGSFGVQGAAATDGDLSCAEGGICKVGDIGPGGGIVFFVRTKLSAARWTKDGEVDAPFHADGWKNLELAPKTWAGGKNDPRLNWCSDSKPSAAWTKDLQGRTYNYKWRAGKPQTGFLVGTGFGNSETISKHCKTGAATAVRKYRGGGKSDWYLPSRTEIAQLQWFAGGGKMDVLMSWQAKDWPTKQAPRFKASVYAFNWGSVYWGSSFSFGTRQAFNDSDQYVFGTRYPSTSGLPYVRPIRAF